MERALDNRARNGPVELSLIRSLVSRILGSGPYAKTTLAGIAVGLVRASWASIPEGPC
jgi:hypothetical protein